MTDFTTNNRIAFYKIKSIGAHEKRTLCYYNSSKEKRKVYFANDKEIDGDCIKEVLLPLPVAEFFEDVLNQRQRFETMVDANNGVRPLLDVFYLEEDK